MMSDVKLFNQIILDKDQIKELIKDKLIPNELVIVKIHFGEPRNKTAFTPEEIKPYIMALTELGFEHLMIDTPVAYDSPRNTKVGYEKAVKERGYGDIGNYLISDNYVNSKIGNVEFEVAEELTEAKNIIVISHVKGHECAGFGGAIKNLGMGALSPKSKSFIHNECKPVVNEELCTGCGFCAQVCPANAIKIIDDKSKPNWDLCWGCSICEIECPFDALNPKLKTFDELLSMGAVSAMKLMPDNSLYFNVIKDVTKMCDCESNSGEIIASDIGTLFSNNPVALDNACLDLINEKENKEVFVETNKKDPRLQINYAEKYSGLESTYNLLKS